MPTTPNYSQLATQRPKAPAPTPAIKPPAPTPVITGTTGSMLAAASVRGPVSQPQQRQIIQAARPQPAPTTTNGYTGMAASVTSAQASQLAAASAQMGGPLSAASAGNILNPQSEMRSERDRPPALVQTSPLQGATAPTNQGKTPLEDMRAGERNPTTTANRPPIENGLGMSGSPMDIGGPGGSPWAGQAGDPSDPSGWSPWGGDSREDAEAARLQGWADKFPVKGGEPATRPGPLTDAHGNRPTPRTDDQRQVTEAARLTLGAISGFDAWPDKMTARLVEEFDYRSLGYNSADEFLAAAGYIFDPASGWWLRGADNAPVLVSDGGGEYPAEELPYEYSYGDYGWGDYGYGGGWDYGSGGGGGGGGYPPGLINWRIG